MGLKFEKSASIEEERFFLPSLTKFSISTDIRCEVISTIDSGRID